MSHSSRNVLSPQNAKLVPVLKKLPVAQYRVMRLLLEPREMAYKKLCRVLQSLPNGKNLSKATIDTALYDLVEAGYLVTIIHDSVVHYVVQIDSRGRPLRTFREQVWNDFNYALDILDYEGE